MPLAELGSWSEADVGYEVNLGHCWSRRVSSVEGLCELVAVIVAAPLELVALLFAGEFL